MHCFKVLKIALVCMYSAEIYDKKNITYNFSYHTPHQTMALGLISWPKADKGAGMKTVMIQSILIDASGYDRAHLVEKNCAYVVLGKCLIIRSMI